MDKKVYSPKGFILFVYVGGDIRYFKQDYPKDMLDFYEVRICGDLMSGKEFYDNVDDTSLIDYDGSMSDVFVDGYRSNLGLFHKGLSQGRFLVDGPTWLDICEEFDVEVEWCNK
jgi:hypothetical protein